MEENSSNCALCPPGRFSTGPNAASCDLCGVGFYLDADNSSCQPCPKGTDCQKVGITLELLPLNRQYWRAFPTASRIHECILPNSCSGGESASDDSYCSEGFTGILCSVCDEASGFFYHDALRSCFSCDGNDRTSAAAAALLLATMFVFVVFGLVFANSPGYSEFVEELQDDMAKKQDKLRGNMVSQIISCGMGPDAKIDHASFRKDNVLTAEATFSGTKGTCVDTKVTAISNVTITTTSVLKKRVVVKVEAKTVLGVATSLGRNLVVPLKLVCGFLQISSFLPNSCNVTLPLTYRACLAFFSFTSLDILPGLGISCLVKFDYIDRLLVVALAPGFVLLSLGLFYFGPCYNLDDRKKNAGRSRFSYIFFLGTFLVNVSVSTTTINMFYCTTFSELNTSFLSQDLSIDCESNRYRLSRYLACGCLVIYTFGIPFLYATALWQHRKVLNDSKCMEKEALEGWPTVGHLKFLTESYAPEHFYYSIIECVHRLVLTGLLICFSSNVAPTLGILVSLVCLRSLTTSSPFVTSAASKLAVLTQYSLIVEFIGVLFFKANENSDPDEAEPIWAALLMAALFVPITSTFWGEFRILFVDLVLNSYGQDDRIEDDSDSDGALMNKLEEESSHLTESPSSPYPPKKATRDPEMSPNCSAGKMPKIQSSRRSAKSLRDSPSLDRPIPSNPSPTGSSPQSSRSATHNQLKDSSKQRSTNTAAKPSETDLIGIFSPEKSILYDPAEDVSIFNCNLNDGKSWKGDMYESESSSGESESALSDDDDDDDDDDDSKESLPPPPPALIPPSDFKEKNVGAKAPGAAGKGASSSLKQESVHSAEAHLQRDNISPESSINDEYNSPQIFIESFIEGAHHEVSHTLSGAPTSVKPANEHPSIGKMYTIKVCSSHFESHAGSYLDAHRSEKRDKLSEDSTLVVACDQQGSDGHPDGNPGVWRLVDIDERLRSELPPGLRSQGRCFHLQLVTGHINCSSGMFLCAVAPDCSPALPRSLKKLIRRNEYSAYCFVQPLSTCSDPVSAVWALDDSDGDGLWEVRLITERVGINSLAPADSRCFLEVHGSHKKDKRSAVSNYACVHAEFEGCVGEFSFTEVSEEDDTSYLESIFDEGLISVKSTRSLVASSDSHNSSDSPPAKQFKRHLGGTVPPQESGSVTAPQPDSGRIPGRGGRGGRGRGTSGGRGRGHGRGTLAARRRSSTSQSSAD